MKKNLTYEKNLPNPVREIQNVFIPMPDGVNLAARIWLPENAAAVPVPGILEFIPYRQRDGTAVRDSIAHPYLAGHGYACVRVDLRGSGDSDGVLQGEYLPQELEDGVEVINWIAAQEWCDGNVGMFGISWGGFNALQIAALTPPPLKAIMSLSSTDDRYADDVHYMGGCHLCENVSWASVMFGFNASPPDPEVVGKKWRRMWMNRLKNSGLWLDTWLRHQRRDDFWKHGSVCEDYSRITCPVFVASGWADGYSNTVFRLLTNLQHVPRLGLIGPWSHMYPHLGRPGPAIGFLQESLRWWDKWLKGKETGIMDEPMLRVWMQEAVEPKTEYRVRPGHWIGETAWPSENIDYVRYSIQGSKILDVNDREDPETPRKNPNDASGFADTVFTIQSPLSVGQFGGKWCSYSATPDLPYDQRQEDGGSLVFDSDVLKTPLALLGAPEVELELSSNKAQGMVAVRLSYISPDDKTTRITYGLLNLTHRDDHENPEMLEPGKRYRIKVKLNQIAEIIPVGNRLRLAISTSYWPLAWPSPEAFRLKIFTNDSRLILPVRLSDQACDQRIRFEKPRGMRPIDRTLIKPGTGNWIISRDLSLNKAFLEIIHENDSLLFEDINLETTRRAREIYSHIGNDYDSVRAETEIVRTYRRNEWNIKVIARTVLTSDSRNFRLRAELDAYEGDSRVFSKSWDRTIPRDHV